MQLELTDCIQGRKQPSCNLVPELLTRLELGRKV